MSVSSETMIDFGTYGLFLAIVFQKQRISSETMCCWLVFVRDGVAATEVALLQRN